MSKQREMKCGEENHKTVYFVWNYLTWGGAQIYFLALARHAAHKFNVKAVLPKGSDKKILQYLEANNIRYDFYEGSLDSEKAETIKRRIERRFNDFFTNWSLARHLSKYDLKNSIIQIDVAPWSGFALLFYLTLKTNVFVTFHTAIPKLAFWRRALWKIKFGLLDFSSRFYIAASNEDVKESLRLFVGERRFRQIEVFYSSVNPEEIEKVLRENTPRREIAERYNFPDEKIWICNVAQFIERKGCWVFLEAAKTIQEKRADVFFFWLGTAPLSPGARAEIETYELDDSFRFLSAGEIGERREDLLRLWLAADVFALPSFQEGLPVALIEAMALGKACVASHINAIPEAVKHFETGILINAGDYENLAAAIAQLADDETLRKKLGENARRTALENFDEKIIGRKMLRLYESALSNK